MKTSNWECSECGQVYSSDEIILWKEEYCPKCGKTKKFNKLD